MKLKKNPKADLRKRSLLFFQLGLILVLFASWRAIEFKAYENGNGDYALVDTGLDLEEEIPITEIKEIEPPKLKIIQIPDEVLVFEDDDDNVDEDIFDDTEADDEPVIYQTDDIDEDMDEEPEEVPFPLIESVPVFPGCESLGSNDAKRDCMSQKISKFVQKKFDTELADELGLEGKQRISVIFKIDQTGKVVDIRARAPHDRLELEAKDVVGQLPDMQPGKQRGKPVIVTYALPIIFQVQN